MAFEEGGERIDDLKALMGRVAYATSLFDQDGISVGFRGQRSRSRRVTDSTFFFQVRFMNSRINVSTSSR